MQVAGPMAVASIGLQAAGTIMKGQGEEAAANAQSMRLQRAAEYGKAAATETDAQMTENLNVQLGNIDVVRAAAGVDPSSPTTAALRDRTDYIGTRAKNIKVGNILAQSEQDEADAGYLRQAGSFAMSMAGLGAAAGVAKGVSQTNWSNFGTG